MTLVTAHHRTFRDVTPGLWGGIGKQWTSFIVVGVDVACQQCTVCWVLPWKYNLHCCRAAKYLALLLTAISVQYYEFVSLLFGMKNVSCYCNSKLPKTYTWSGTFILKRWKVYVSFFLWRYLKGRVYHYKPRNIDALKANVTEEIQAVTADVLARNFQNMARGV
jgi:hypothetical protein